MSSYQSAASWACAPTQAAAAATLATAVWIITTTNTAAFVQQAPKSIEAVQR
jgi:hypothetical protein